MKKEIWLKKKKVTGTFAVIALISGAIFLRHNITGNIILSDKYSFNLLSLIGLLLVLCSTILGAYSIKKRK